MPQTTPERAARWTDETAIAHLRNSGWVLQKEWFWKHTDPNYKPTHTDADAAVYLIQEWDFDGLEYNV